MGGLLCGLRGCFWGWLGGVLVGVVSSLPLSHFILPFIHSTNANPYFLVRSLLYRSLAHSRAPNPSHPLAQMVPHPLRRILRPPRDNRLGGSNMEREESLGGHAFFDADYEYCCWVRLTLLFHFFFPSFGLSSFFPFRFPWPKSALF